MPTELIILLIFILVISLVIGLNFKVIPQDEIGVVERLGSYHKTLEPGLHFLIPFIDRLNKVKKDQSIELKQTMMLNMKPQYEVGLTLFYKIKNIFKYLYENNNVKKYLETFIIKESRIFLDKNYQLGERECRPRLIEHLEYHFRNNTWGIEVTGIEISILKIFV